MAKRGRAGQLWARGRNLLTYLIVCFAGCTCEAEHRTLASTDDGTLETDYSKELGCGAAGGHGFGIIFPTVDRDYDQRLTVHAGPAAGTYRVPARCACEGDEAALEVDPSSRRALVACTEDAWDVYYLVRPNRLHCLQGQFDARPNWSVVPQLDGAALLLMGGRVRGDMVQDVSTLHGSSAAAKVLAEAVAVGGDDWVTEFEKLPPADRAVPLEALRAALAADSVPRAALRRAFLLGEEGRELTIAAIDRFVRATDADSQRHLKAYHYDPARFALRKLAETSVADLSTLVCTMMAENQCRDECLVVLAQTDNECPGLGAYLSLWACDIQLDCSSGECTEAALNEKLRDDTLRERRAASYRAYLAAIRRPELGTRLFEQWARRHYTVDQPKTPCVEVAFGEPCHCGNADSLERRACSVEASETTFLHGACEVHIDDDARVIQGSSRLERRRPADAGDVGLEDRADAAFAGDR